MEAAEIPGICERDIDLLLLEELSVNPAFAARLITHVTSSAPSQVTSVRKSVTQSSGESDLEVTWHDAAGQVGRLLIENKVDASFQRDQAGRYRQRAQAYVKGGACAAAWTLIIAPASYFAPEAGGHGFDVAVSYETVQEWFAESDLGHRGAYKRAVLAAAIAKSSLGYNPIQDDTVSRFWRDYWEASVAEAPSLGMAEPGPKPAGSTWIYFMPGGLPREVWLLHKVTAGAVELTLGGLGDRVGEVRALLLPVLEADMRVERTGKSTSVRLAVSPMEMTRPLSDQAMGARAAFAAASRLLGWLASNRRLVESLWSTA